jgi:NADP-reducing hydrogenase subunit HndB
MPKLKPEDLAKIKEEMRKVITLRSGEGRVKITVHMGTCGIAAGARKVMSALLSAIEEKNARDVVVTTSGCAGLCSREPMATVEIKGQPPVKYTDLNEEKIKKIFEAHVLGGQIVKEYAFAIGSEQVL